MGMGMMRIFLMLKKNKFYPCPQPYPPPIIKSEKIFLLSMQMLCHLQPPAMGGGAGAGAATSSPLVRENYLRWHPPHRRALVAVRLHAPIWSLGRGPIRRLSFPARLPHPSPSTAKCHWIPARLQCRHSVTLLCVIHLLQATNRKALGYTSGCQQHNTHNTHNTKDT